MTSLKKTDILSDNIRVSQVTWSPLSKGSVCLHPALLRRYQWARATWGVHLWRWWKLLAGLGHSSSKIRQICSTRWMSSVRNYTTMPTCCVLSSLPPAQRACPESGIGMTTAPAEGCSAVAGFLTGAALLTCPIKWNQFPKSGTLAVLIWDVAGMWRGDLELIIIITDYNNNLWHPIS